MPGDMYGNFAALVARERLGVDYRVVVCPQPSPVAVIAPHGGGIEPGTSELAAAIAGQEFSLYCFEGRKRTGNEVLHITCTRFDEPTCLTTVAASPVVLVLHGFDEQREIVHIGGLGTQLAGRLNDALAAAGFAAQMDNTTNHPGRHTNNICNRGSSGRGCQLELSKGLRLTLFEGLSRRQGERPTKRFHEFVASIRAVLLADHD